MQSQIRMGDTIQIGLLELQNGRLWCHGSFNDNLALYYLAVHVKTHAHNCVHTHTHAHTHTKHTHTYNNVLYSSQQEIKAVIQSYTLMHVAIITYTLLSCSAWKNTSTHTHACVHAHTHACTHMWECMCTQTHTHAHAHTHTHTHKQTCTHVRTHAQTYAHIHMRTHTHTHMQAHTCTKQHIIHQDWPFPLHQCPRSACRHCGVWRISCSRGQVQTWSSWSSHGLLGLFWKRKRKKCCLTEI